MVRSNLRLGITGAGGFLGSAATEHFAVHSQIAEVRAFYSAALSTPLPTHTTLQVKTFRGDLCDAGQSPQWLAGVDAVLHFANRGFPAQPVGKPEEMVARNLAATSHLVRAMKTHGVKTLIYVSSGGAIYKDMGVQKPFKEDAPVEFRTPYAQYKVATENFLATQVKQEGMRIYSLRLANPYGPGQFGRTQQGFVGVACEKLMTGQPLPVWGSLDTQKDFIYIEDFLALIEAFLFRKAVVAGNYNVGSGKATALKDVVKLLEKISGKKLKTEMQPARPGDATWTALDMSKTHRATGFKAEYSLEEGLKKTWEAIQRRAPKKRAA